MPRTPRRGDASGVSDPAGSGPTAAERFADLAVVLSRIPGVTPPDGSRGFGSDALRIRKKIFTMVVRDRLVVKLPKARVDALVASGDGIRFDANKGTPMKEWLSLNPDSAMDWEQLAREALEFVGTD